jgi:hypothetical protein
MPSIPASDELSDELGAISDELDAPNATQDELDELDELPLAIYLSQCRGDWTGTRRRHHRLPIRNWHLATDN